MYVFDSNRYRLLKQIDYSLGKRRGELPGLLEGETVHVKYDDRAGDLRARLQHGSLQIQHASLVDLVKAAFIVLPLFAELDYQHTSAMLVAIRQHGQDVLLEDILLSARLQVIVHGRVLYFEVVIVLDEIECRLGIVLARPQKSDQPGLIIQRAFQILLGCQMKRIFNA